MDQEDRDHFKTIALASAKQQIGSSTQPNAGNLQSRHDQASCLAKAKAIFGCYRRDEAHDPEGFVAALASILGDYPAHVVDYAADPRTGVCCDYPMGLPNVGQIRQFCDAIAQRMELLAKPKAIPKPYIPHPLKPGQLNSDQFFELVVAGKTKMRPIGAFEKGGYLGPRGD